MNASDYTRGPGIKMAAVRVGDRVWVGPKPLRVAAKTETQHNWFKLTFENNSMEYSSGGNVVIDLAEPLTLTEVTARVMLAHENAAQQEIIVDLRTEVIELQAKVRARELEIHELEEQLRHQADASEMLRYKKKAQDNVVRLIDAEAKVRDIEQRNVELNRMLDEVYNAVMHR